MSKAKSVCSASPSSQGTQREWPFALPIIDTSSEPGNWPYASVGGDFFGGSVCAQTVCEARQGHPLPVRAQRASKIFVKGYTVCPLFPINLRTMLVNQ